MNKNALRIGLSQREDVINMSMFMFDDNIFLSIFTVDRNIRYATLTKDNNYLQRAVKELHVFCTALLISENHRTRRNTATLYTSALCNQSSHGVSLNPSSGYWKVVQTNISGPRGYNEVCVVWSEATTHTIIEPEDDANLRSAMSRSSSGCWEIFRTNVLLSVFRRA